jgi:NADH:ubiquinone oxidoreductase subunit 3 (subunit A)
LVLVGFFKYLFKYFFIFFFFFLLVEFSYLFFYLLGCLFLVVLLLLGSLFFVNQSPDVEKLSAYECGFNPYEDARSRFEVRFFLVGILFIVFDLEVSYLLP